MMLWIPFPHGLTAARRGCTLKGVLLLVLGLQGGAEDVAERRTRVGRAVLSHGFLLLSDLEGLDGDGHATGLAVELRDAGIELLAGGEALGALVGAVTSELVALDEGGEVGVDDLHLQAAVLHLENLAGDDLALLDLAGFGEGIARKLLDAERDALLLDVHVENLGAHDIALLEVVDDLLARTVPAEIREVDHAVDVVLEADEQAELGLVLHLALDRGADRVLLGEGLPRVLERLLQAQRDAALHLVDLEDHDLNLLRGGDDLAGVDVLLRPGHLGDVDQAFDAGLELDERTVIGDVRDAALELGVH